MGIFRASGHFYNRISVKQLGGLLMGEFNKGPGDGHRYIHGVPDKPDNKFWQEVQSYRDQLKDQLKTQPKIQAQELKRFDDELEESLDQRANRAAKQAEARAVQEQKAAPLDVHNPMMKQMEDLAREQQKAQAQTQVLKEQVIQALLKKGVIHSRAEIEDYRNPNFTKNQVYFDGINNRLIQMQMEMQKKMLPYDQSK